MKKEINRRRFLQLTAAGSVLCLAGVGCQEETKIKAVLISV
jgi:hypothetical protein